MTQYIRYPNTGGGGGVSTTLASGKIYVGNASNVATAQAVSGDASLSNAGVLTVTSVGGSSAANVNAATVLANNATALNTINQIVLRDGSGNFAAGTITATLTGTATNVSGTVLVNHGGTGLTSGTDGGILGFTATGTLASSALLVANRLMLGGGAGATPLTMASAGTTTTLLHGNAAGAPTFGAVVLTTDVSGVLPLANGGTNANALAAGAAISTGTALSTEAQLAVTRGGTGLSAGTSGGVLAYTASGTLASSGALTANAIVLGGGAGAVPSVLGSLGTTTTVLHGNAAGAPTFGAVALASDVSGSLPAVNGGTAQTTYTLGDTLYSSATNTLSKLAGNTTAVKQFLSQTGTGAVSAAPAWSNFTAPTIQKFTSTGTTTGYLFTVTSANATIGATYTNNGQTFTVLATIAGATQLFTSSAGAPAASGTLTKSAGTGDASITFSAAVALASYTTPAGVLYLKPRVVGGGGGGAGSANNTANGVPGGVGGISAFGAGMIVCNGGSGGGANSNPGGNGGTATLGTGPIGFALQGGKGAGGDSHSATAGVWAGGCGASSPFGGQGGSNGNAIANSGSGGGGAECPTSGFPGSGGGAGGYADAIIVPTAGQVFVYAVGAAGALGTAGAGGTPGGTGGSGFVIIEEHYQ